MKFIKQKARGSAEQRSAQSILGEEITEKISPSSTDPPEQHYMLVSRTDSTPTSYTDTREDVIKLTKAENTKRVVCKSLAIANALELLKVFFLTSSSCSEVQAALTATLKLYAESEIFTALSFLREKNFMVSMCNLSTNISNLAS
jgi:general transcription factor 3C polypeptide 1